MPIGPFKLAIPCSSSKSPLWEILAGADFFPVHLFMSQDFNLIILKCLVVLDRINQKEELGAGKGKGR